MTSLFSLSLLLLLAGLAGPPPSSGSCGGPAAAAARREWTATPGYRLTQLAKLARSLPSRRTP